MEKLIKLEEIAQFLVTIVFFVIVEADWWWYLLLIIGPDISMFGYAINTKIGAISYNLFHHKGLAILLFLIGLYMQHDPILLFGAVLFGHAALDRALGFGLKFFDDFKHTHLGRIGKEVYEE